MAGFTDTALAQLRRIVAEELARASGGASLADLGNLLSHGQLPTDPAGAPSRVGLDQVDSQLTAMIEALGALSDIEAQLEQIRAMLMGGGSAGGKLVLTFEPYIQQAGPLSELPLPSSGTPIAFEPDALPREPVDQQPGAPA